VTSYTRRLTVPSDAVLHGPVRFSAEWLDHCCTGHALEQCHTGAGEQPLRRGRRLRFQQGVRHRATQQRHGQGGTTSITGLRAQLASQLPRRTQSLHAVQRLHVGLT